MTITRHDVTQRMSQIVVHGDTIYLAGQVADDTSVSVAGQTDQILSKIDNLLAKVDSDKSKLLSAVVWLTDISTFNEMNVVWDAWVASGNPPVRACIEAQLSSPQRRVEIMVTAAR